MPNKDLIEQLIKLLKYLFSLFSSTDPLIFVWQVTFIIWCFIFYIETKKNLSETDQKKVAFGFLAGEIVIIIIMEVFIS